MSGHFSGARYRSVLLCGAFLFALVIGLWAAHSTPGKTGSPVNNSEFRAEPSPVRLERGRYIVEGIAHCFKCHGEQDYAHGSDLPLPGRKGVGQEIKGESYDGEPFPEGLVCPNITPDKETGAGTWTDTQFERAIRHGIGHDGRQLYDYMPYAFFRSMTDEDVASVIVYIRSLPAVRNPLPKNHLPYEAKVDLHPELEPKLPADASEQVRHGWYLVRLAQCNDCHTPFHEDGTARTDMMFGGGQRMTGPWGDVVTPNITSDPTGISHYDEVMFIKTLRTGHASGGVRELNTFMPYHYFRNMTDDDLKAIFAYLRVVKPVRHNVDNSEEATLCPVCRNKHGFGNRN